MRIDNYGNLIYYPNDVFSLLYKGELGALKDITVADDPEIESLEAFAYVQLNHTQLQQITPEEQDSINQDNWQVPVECFDLDIKEYCLASCTNETEERRVLEEFEIFEEKKMIKLLQVLKYLVDTFRENNVVWGVGRGSSVASYVLFLIGVHKIDSLKYNLDYHEFLR